MNISTLSLLIFTAVILTPSAFADTYVQGYVKKDGTYVQPHYRSDSDSSRYNNYSTQGNTNPYTGQRGYESPNPRPAPVYQVPTYPQPSTYQPYRTPYNRQP